MAWLYFWGIPPNHDQTRSLVGYPWGLGFYYSRSSSRKARTASRSPIFLQLPAPARPAGLVGAQADPARDSGVPPDGAGSVSAPLLPATKAVALRPYAYFSRCPLRLCQKGAEGFRHPFEGCRVYWRARRSIGTGKVSSEPLQSFGTSNGHLLWLPPAALVLNSDCPQSFEAQGGAYLTNHFTRS